MYRTRQAAKYVGLKFTTFIYHIQEGHIREEYRIKGERVFSKDALDNFKKKHIADVGMTKEQIAERYQQEIPVVRGHLRRKNIQPIAKNGKSFIYTTKDIEALAQAVGWTEQTFLSDGNAVSAQSVNDLLPG